MSGIPAEVYSIFGSIGLMIGLIGNSTALYAENMFDVSKPDCAFLILNLSGPIWKCAPVPPVRLNVAASVSSFILKPF